MSSPLPPGPYGSLNRLPLQVWPDGLPDSVELPTTGSRLLSLATLNKLIIQHAKPLGFSDNIFPSREMPMQLNDSFFAEDMGVRMAATAISRHFGRYLAAVLLTLREANIENQGISEYWPPTAWQAWETIRKVWIGGGLVAGMLGEMAIAYAQKLVNQAGVVDLTVHRAPFPDILPPIGVARYAPPNAKYVLVFDFGQSFVKRAIAAFDNDALTTLYALPEVPSRHIKSYRSNAGSNQIQDLLNYMVEVLERTWDMVHGRGLQPHPTLLVALASRIQDGNLIGNESYGSLQQLADDVPALISQQASDTIGQTVSVSLVNDAVSAACAFAGENHTAVITLGTNIGSAFAPSSEGLRDIDLAQLTVEDAPQWFI